jgi:hypothetical protein
MIKIKFPSVIKGYHVYRIKPDVGEELQVCPKPCQIDPKAYGIYNLDGKLVGHAPAKPPVNEALSMAHYFDEDNTTTW